MSLPDGAGHGTVGILGVGSLAGAVVEGLCEGVDVPPRVVLSPRGADTATRLAATYPTVRVAADNQAVLDASDTVLVCLRERDAGVLSTLTWSEAHCVVSATAGLSAARLAAAVAPARQLARAVPMVAVAERAWTTPVRPAVPRAVALLERLGGAMAMGSDEEFDAVYTALGTVAPFVDYLRTVSAFLADHGVDRPAADRLLGRSFALLAPELAAADVDLGRLLRAHAPSGGGNDQLATLLREAGVPAATRAALDEVFRRQTHGVWE
ncbi:NAD(P)-binding domain-containing protein [Ornithinimicrobium tianjinense]|uniref:Pyrroline-5-carboxylate reductase catalytic N-terminal domain-containing protein n=1 Tax=Ornithinimicrobium tianjinense TaxID=1195761 RepID=A0A917BKZ2_9MICO|nr:NAD(P)-binding domain-containing protein [Ornithinimicrobium tianjinense]GGF46332.1 hypothetical protein GCM10011366_12580 [Ornithinimicrobium tianjinense]